MSFAPSINTRGAARSNACFLSTSTPSTTPVSFFPVGLSLASCLTILTKTNHNAKPTHAPTATQYSVYHLGLAHIIIGSSTRTKISVFGAFSVDQRIGSTYVLAPRSTCAQLAVYSTDPASHRIASHARRSGRVTHISPITSPITWPIPAS